VICNEPLTEDDRLKEPYIILFKNCTAHMTHSCPTNKRSCWCHGGA